LHENHEQGHKWQTTTTSVERVPLQQYQCTALFSHPTTLQQQRANLTACIRMAAAVLGAIQHHPVYTHQLIAVLLAFI
jgi:hypothetical protein